MERQAFQFDTRGEFDAHLRQCFARARVRLRLFDPDFALWSLETSETEALLRHFLLHKGKLELLAHDRTWLERQCPRFMNLLRDFGDAIECRVSGKHLRQLTDSFCIADERDIVRRFHSAHLRGETVFDGPDDTTASAERFSAMWSESEPGLRGGATGL
jgi:hypothetical protein